MKFTELEKQLIIRSLKQTIEIDKEIKHELENNNCKCNTIRKYIQIEQKIIKMLDIK